MQGLVVELRGSNGRAAAGEVVRVEQLPYDSAAYPAAVLVAPAAGAWYGPFVAETTDAQGRITALLELGQLAGAARLAVTAPRFGIQDTVYFTVLPGAATQVIAGPLDTAVYVGQGFQARGYVADANGNRRADAITVQALDTGLTVSGQQVTGAVIGRSSVRVKAATASIAATIAVSVVPQGTIAAVAGWFSPWPQGTIVTMGLDGSNVAVVPQSAAENNWLQWTPGGTGILHYRPMFSGHINTIALNGTLTRLVSASAGFAEDNWARIAAGGSWVYFRAARGFPGTGYIWRARPDGSALDSVPVGSGTQPSPSPDGDRVAYVAEDGHIHVYDYGLGADTDLGIPGHAPHWSPDGASIAYTSGAQGTITLISPAGTNARTLTLAGTFDWAFDWSPDSQWLVGFDSNRASLLLIDVQTERVLPLAFTAYLFNPTWRP